MTQAELAHHRLWIVNALKFAGSRALQVMFGGSVAVCFYLGLIMVGPRLEGQILPVVVDYRLTETTLEANGGIGFTPTFRKARDCDYFGTTWFAPDGNGDLVRLQAQTPDDAAPPTTGPVSSRVGKRTILYPPPGATTFEGYMHHQCGRPWQTRSRLGPFTIWRK